MSANDHSPFATVPVLRSSVCSKVQADNSIPETRTRTHSIVSGSSHSAHYGSATSSELPSSSRPPTDQTPMDHKAGEPHAPCPQPMSVPPPAKDRSSPTCPRDPVEMPQNVSESTPELDTAEPQGHAGERLLHFALPWAVGQRMLAMMAGQDARSVHSGDSEPLPAYEPRG
ncbi:hypothetical protein VTO73DRAFT_9042 [Trametes versicolor]